MDDINIGQLDFVTVNSKYRIGNVVSAFCNIGNITDVPQF